MPLVLLLKAFGIHLQLDKTVEGVLILQFDL